MKEYKCLKCKGKGFDIHFVESTGSMYWTRCDDCLGKGKMDWLENIIGVYLRYGYSGKNLPTFADLNDKFLKFTQKYKNKKI